MNRCEKCGGEVRTATLDKYNAKSLVGLPVMLIESVEARQCAKCGDLSEVSIPDPNGLITAVAISRVMSPEKLHGKEIRFMRKALDISAVELAEMLGVQPETLSRWENDAATIGPANEKLLRFIVGIKLDKSGKAPGILFDEETIVQMNINSVALVGKKEVQHFQIVKILKEKSHIEPIWAKVCENVGIKESDIEMGCNET